jgi:hypothetical protein
MLSTDELTLEENRNYYWIKDSQFDDLLKKIVSQKVRDENLGHYYNWTAPTFKSELKK